LQLVAGSDDHARYRGPLQQPVQSDLRHGLAGLLVDLVQRIDNLIEKVVGNGT
jgi:hypothetical protein